MERWIRHSTFPQGAGSEQWKWRQMCISDANTAEREVGSEGGGLLIWAGGHFGEGFMLRMQHLKWILKWGLGSMPAWVPRKLTLRQWLWCRGVLSSVLGVPTAEGREGGRIQGICKKGLKWVLGELWGWGGPSELSWVVARKLGLYTLMLLLRGHVALGRCLFGEALPNRADSWGCLPGALPIAGGISPPVLKGIWVVHCCVPSGYAEIWEK